MREKKRDRHLLNIERATLEAFCAHHLIRKAKSGKIERNWLESTETRLARAIEFVGPTRELDQIDVADVEAWAEALSERGGGRYGNKTLSPQTVRHHLNTLSNVYKRAIAERRVAPGYNPVAGMLDKPSVVKKEARWLEIHEAALYLEAARHYRPTREEQTLPFAYALIACFLLTGGREAEVFGLEVDDVSFRRRVITFRTNAWRRLKTATSQRPVPLWPQLEVILREHMAERERTGGLGRLLFPSVRSV